ncbi:MAG: hypothetical protein EBW36_04520 [Actinobacteria bacterium]|nr:hypothetical protein [Actinomycetota bacterium]
MSNELLVVFYILLTLAFAYLWFYPKVVGERVKLMAWMDVVVTGIPLAISALLFWESDPTFRLLIFDLNWFFFTLLAMFAIELPIFLLYLRARGLNEKYWAMFRMAPKGSPDAAWASASVKSVEKQLNDTRWDGLRTASGKRVLLWGSNIMILFGTGYLWLVGDSGWAAYSLIHILLIFVFGFLLRQSVRLVADAPEEALDEMLIQLRDRSYLVAYRWLSVLAFLAASALLAYSIFSDFQDGSDGFNYLLAFTWPQVQAVFWLIFTYVFMMPSMAMISLELKREKSAGKR